MAYKYQYDSDTDARAYKPPRLRTNRSMWKLMLLNILTLGIYGIIFFIPFSFDLDKIAPRKDHGRTMNYLFAYIISLFTFSIVLSDVSPCGEVGKHHITLRRRSNTSLCRSHNITAA